MNRFANLAVETDDCCEQHEEQQLTSRERRKLARAQAGKAEEHDRRLAQAEEEARLKEEQRWASWVPHVKASEVAEMEPAQRLHANLAEIRRIYQEAGQNPVAAATLEAAVSTSSPHPAWFAVCPTPEAVLAVAQRAFTDSHQHRFPTLCDANRVMTNLITWCCDLGRSSVALQGAVRMDRNLYAAFVRVLGPDAWRFVKVVPFRSILPFASSLVQMRRLVDSIPEADLHCNGDVKQQLVWPREELAQHLFDVANYVPAPHEHGHPRPYVTALVKAALLRVTNPEVAVRQQRQPKQQQKQQQQQQQPKQSKAVRRVAKGV